MTNQTLISLQSDAVTKALASLTRQLSNPSALMASISAELTALTRENFSGQSIDHKKWPELAKSTKAARAKKGKWPGQILQVSQGGLMASIQSHHSSRKASIGSNKVYAAIHQLGGRAGRNQSVNIPTRGYLPFTQSGSGMHLTGDAEVAIVDLVQKMVIGAI